MKVELSIKDADKIINYLRTKLEHLQVLAASYEEADVVNMVARLYGDNEEFYKNLNGAKIKNQEEIEEVQNYILLLTKGSENEN